MARTLPYSFLTTTFEGGTLIIPSKVAWLVRALNPGPLIPDLELLSSLYMAYINSSQMLVVKMSKSFCLFGL